MGGVFSGFLSREETKGREGDCGIVGLSLSLLMCGHCWLGLLYSGLVWFGLVWQRLEIFTYAKSLEYCSLDIAALKWMHWSGNISLFFHFTFKRDHVPSLDTFCW